MPNKKSKEIREELDKEKDAVETSDAIDALNKAKKIKPHEQKAKEQAKQKKIKPASEEELRKLEHEIIGIMSDIQESKDDIKEYQTDLSEKLRKYKEMM